MKNEIEIKKEKDTLVVKIPLKQTGKYTYGDEKWFAPNLVGIIAGDEFSLSQMIYLDYKDDYQEGSPIIMFDTKEELEKICRDFNISIWEHSVCKYCNKAIRGSYTFGSKGEKCFNCEHSN